MNNKIVVQSLLKLAKSLIAGIRFDNVKVGMKAVVKDRNKNAQGIFNVVKKTSTLIFLDNGKKYDKYGYEKIPLEKQKGMASWMDETIIDIPESYQ